MRIAFSDLVLVRSVIVGLFCSVFSLQTSWSATVVFGDVSGTWTKIGSPYILSSDCIVASNQSLSIQPGAEIEIRTNVSLNVLGGIAAIGTPEMPVIIRGSGSAQYWGSINIGNSGSTNRFRNCRISEGTEALSFTAAGGNRHSYVEILACDFTNCTDAAIFVFARGVPVGENDSGSATVSLDVHNCVFSQASYGCYLGTGSIDAYLDCKISGNIFKNLYQSAFQLYSYGATNISRPSFKNNIVADAPNGVRATARNLLPIVRNNIFLRNTRALFRDEQSASIDTAYNCFYQNTFDFGGYPASYGLLLSANHNGNLCDAFFNIFIDPQFTDTNRFLFSNSSPCVDAGDPAIADTCFQFSHGSAISDIGPYGGPDACGWLTHGFAPVITAVPSDQSGCIGGDAKFNVRANGNEPLIYRWYFGASLLSGETNAQLNLSNLQPNQAGFYSVTVSNVFGTVTSSPARLLVSDACVGINLFAGLSITGIVGRTYAIETAMNLGASNWSLVTTNTFTTPRWLFIDTNTPFTPGSFFRVRLLP